MNREKKFVFMGGSEGRIKKFAQMAYDEFSSKFMSHRLWFIIMSHQIYILETMKLPDNCAKDNLAESAGRYVTDYKIFELWVILYYSCLDNL